MAREVSNTPENVAAICTALLQHRAVRVEIEGIHVDFVYGLQELDGKHRGDFLLVAVTCYKCYATSAVANGGFRWNHFFDEERDREDGDAIALATNAVAAALWASHRQAGSSAQPILPAPYVPAGLTLELPE